MPKRRQHPARVIPRSHENNALQFLSAQQFDGELRVFFRRARPIFHFNYICGHARLNQQAPVDFAIAKAADNDARRDLFLEKFRRAFGTVVRTTAQNDKRVGFYRPAVHAQKFLRKKQRGDCKQHQQQNKKCERNFQKRFRFPNHAAENDSFSISRQLARKKKSNAGQIPRRLLFCVR